MYIAVLYPRPFVAIVQPVGELNRDSCDHLRQCLETLVRENNPFLVLDLAQTLIANAMELQGMLESLRWTQRQGCTLLLVAPAARLRAALKGIYARPHVCPVPKPGRSPGSPGFPSPIPVAKKPLVCQNRPNSSPVSRAKKYATACWGWNG